MFRWCSHDKLNMNNDKTYKQTKDRNQPMQLDSLKVTSKSTITPTHKVGGRSQKGFVLWLCIFLQKSDSQYL